LPKKHNSDKNSIPKSGYHHHFQTHESRDKIWLNFLLDDLPLWPQHKIEGKNKKPKKQGLCQIVALLVIYIKKVSKGNKEEF